MVGEEKEESELVEIELLKCSAAQFDLNPREEMDNSCDLQDKRAVTMADSS